mmetsp:Transcript_22282/g.37931  ORF Transcript_22282/g.37931 Transcript_22282/m.37931 type:complete len:213 (-) Transcript_22282:157-795(-)
MISDITSKGEGSNIVFGKGVNDTRGVSDPNAVGLGAVATRMDPNIVSSTPVEGHSVTDLTGNGRQHVTFGDEPFHHDVLLRRVRNKASIAFHADGNHNDLTVLTVSSNIASKGDDTNIVGGEGVRDTGSASNPNAASFGAISGRMDPDVVGSEPVEGNGITDLGKKGRERVSNGNEPIQHNIHGSASSTVAGATTKVGDNSSIHDLTVLAMS